MAEREQAIALMEQQQEVTQQQISNENNRVVGQGTNRGISFAGRGRKKRTQYRPQTAGPDGELAGQISDEDDSRDPADYQCMLTTPASKLDANVRKAKNTLMVSA